MISEPKASVPKWYLEKKYTVIASLAIFFKFLHNSYLIVRPRPWDKVKNGTFDLWNVQYHVANVEANTISLNAAMKNITQKKPNTFIAWEQSNRLVYVLLNWKSVSWQSILCIVHEIINFTWKYVTIDGLAICLKLHAATLQALIDSVLSVLTQYWLKIFGSHRTPS